MTIEERIDALTKRVAKLQKETIKGYRLSRNKPIDQIKQYLILSSPALEPFKENFEREEKVEKQKPLSDYKDITEEEALREIRSRNSFIRVER